MMNHAKFGGGGDKIVSQYIEDAALLGVNLIELVWISKNGLPIYDTMEVIGFKYPVLIDSGSEDNKLERWVERTLKFFPDQKGRCWGYVFDSPENRELIIKSLSTGWFKIADQKMREELIKEAEAQGIKTAIVPKTEVNIKKSVREINAEQHAKELQNKLDDMKDKERKLIAELERAKNERMVHTTRRLEGTPVPIIDTEIKKD